MKIDNLEKAIASFIDAYAKSLKGAFGGRWPMPHVSSVDAMMLIDTYMADYFFEIWNEIEKKKGSINKIAQQVTYPSPLSRIFFASRALKVNNYSYKRIMRMMTINAEIMAQKYKKDPFCKNGANILCSQEELNKQAKQQFIYCKKNKKECSLLYKINGLMWLYTELVFMYFHNYGHEFHGPYKFGKYQLLIRDWHDLKVNYFKFTKKFPVPFFRSYEIYRNDVKIKFDVSNRMYTSKPLTECLVGFSLTVNNQQLNNTKKLKEFVQQIESVIKLAMQSLKNADRKSLMPKVAAMQFYVLKPFADIVGMSCAPTKACMKRIRNGKLTNYQSNIVKKVVAARLERPLIKAMFDPRIPEFGSVLDKYMARD